MLTLVIASYHVEHDSHDHFINHTKSFVTIYDAAVDNPSLAWNSFSLYETLTHSYYI